MTFIKCTWPKGFSQMQDGGGGTLLWKGRRSRDCHPKQWGATSLPVTWSSTVSPNTQLSLPPSLNNTLQWLPSVALWNLSFLEAHRRPIGWICYRPPQPDIFASHHTLPFFICLENHFSFQTPKPVSFPENWPLPLPFGVSSSPFPVFTVSLVSLP